MSVGTICFTNCFNVLTPSSRLDHKLFERKKPRHPSLENLAQCWASNKQLQLYLQQKVPILAETSFFSYFALTCDTGNLTYLTCQVCSMVVTARTLHNASYLLFSETGSLEWVGVGDLRKKRHRTKAAFFFQQTPPLLRSRIIPITGMSS